MRKIVVLTVGLALVGALTARADKEVSQTAIDRVHELLRSSAQYSSKVPYSKIVSHVFLGYDKEGNVEQGIALRAFKSYEWVTAMVVVKVDGQRYVVEGVDIPDAERIENAEKRGKVVAALKDIKGRVVRDETQALKKIDAVTGATRYTKRIYLYSDILAKALVAEMNANPDWAKQPTR